MHTLVLLVSNPAGAGLKRVRSLHCRVTDLTNAQARPGAGTFVDFVWHSGRGKDEGVAQVRGDEVVVELLLVSVLGA